jgi:hypothetical protein
MKFFLKLIVIKIDRRRNSNMVFNPSFDFGRAVGELKRKKSACVTTDERTTDLKERDETMSEKITVRTVYDFPVAGHLCDDGTVRYVKLVRRSGQQPEGTCPLCKTSFLYRKPKASKSARHVDGEGIVHF